MMQMLNNWGPVAVIVGGYLLGIYFQNKRHDDFKELFFKRHDDFKEVFLKSQDDFKELLFKYLDSKFEALRTELRSEVKRLEDKIDHLERPVVKP